MDILKAGQIVRRVISEVGGTIATNGVQELSRDDHGSGVSSFSYIRMCLIMTAYNAVRALPGFNMTQNEFVAAVEAETAALRGGR